MRFRERGYCRVDNNLRDYMSREEREQMDALIDRARKRKERREEAVIGAKRFQFLQCQCACRREMEGETGSGPGKNREEEMEQLLKAVCDFCLKYNLCQCPHSVHRFIIFVKGKWQGAAGNRGSCDVATMQLPAEPYEEGQGWTRNYRGN